MPEQVHLGPHVHLFGLGQTVPPSAKFIRKLYFPFLQRNIPPKVLRVNRITLATRDEFMTPDFVNRNRYGRRFGRVWRDAPPARWHPPARSPRSTGRDP